MGVRARTEAVFLFLMVVQTGLNALGLIGGHPVQISQRLQEHEAYSASAFADWRAAHDASKLRAQRASALATQQHNVALADLDDDLTAANEAAVAQWRQAKVWQAVAAERRWRQVHAMQRPGPGTAGNFVRGCRARRHRRRAATCVSDGAGLAERGDKSALPPLHERTACTNSAPQHGGGAPPTQRVSALRRRHARELQLDAGQRAAERCGARERGWNCLPLIVHKPNSYLFSVPARAKQGGVLAKRLFDLEPRERPPAHAIC